MQTEKYCGICGQKLNIEFEYRKTAKTTCPRCESESEWKFYKNGNFTELIHVSDNGLEIQAQMEREENAV